MLDDYPLEELGSYGAIPHPFGIHDDDRTTRTDAKTWCLRALHSTRTREKTFTLEQRSQQRIERSPAAIR